MKKCLIWAIVFMLVFSFASSAVAKETIEIGDYVLMGTYYGKPILWRCIDIDENGPLMFSDKIICIKAFDAPGSLGPHQRLEYSEETDRYVIMFTRRIYGSEHWKISNIRAWLNSTAVAGEIEWPCENPPVSGTKPYSISNPYADEAGFLTNFTDKEQSAMKTVTQRTALSPYVYTNGVKEDRWLQPYKNIGIEDIVNNYDTSYSEMVTDTMFLVDVKQLNASCDNLGIEYICKGITTQECRDNSNYQVKEQYYYFTRDIYSNPFNVDFGSVLVVSPPDADHAHYHLGSSYPVGERGIRPAFYLDTEQIYFRDGDGSESAPYTLTGGVRNPESQIADIEYELKDGVLTVKGEGEMPDYKSTSPAPWNSLSENVTDIVVEEGITHIGNQAFSRFSNLKTVSLPQSLKYIGNYAFANCKALETVNMYGATSGIGMAAFNGCDSLGNININGTLEDYNALGVEKTNLSFERANITYTHENGNVYASMSIYARWAYDTQTKTLYINNYPHVASRDMLNYKKDTDLPWNAYIDEIERVEINSVASAGSRLVIGAENVKALFCDDTVKKINSWAFFNCSNLQELKLGANITAIGTGAFNGAASLSSVEFNNTKDKYDSITFGKQNNPIIRATTSLTDGVTGYQGGNVYWNIKNGVLTVTGTGAMTSISSPEKAPWYEYRNEVTKIVVEKGVTSVAKNAFNNLTNLETVEIGEGVTTIGTYAFKNSAVKTVYLPSTIQTVGTSSFSGCGKLTEVVYNGTPEKLGKITVGSGNTRFEVATKMYTATGTYGNITYTVNKDLLTLSGTGAMRSISSPEAAPWYPYKDVIKTVVVEDGVTTIAANAFMDFSAIEKLELSKTMVTVGSYAFQNSPLKLIVMYPSLETIGYYAFAGCSSINMCINYHGTPEEFSAITVRSGNKEFMGAARSFVY